MTTSKRRKQNEITYGPTLFGGYQVKGVQKKSFSERISSFPFGYRLSSSTLCNHSSKDDVGYDGTTTTSQNKSKHRQQQQNYLTQIKDFKGVSKSITSGFVAHFVCNQNNTYTIAQAIESVLPKPVPNVRIHSNTMRQFVLGDGNDINNDDYETNIEMSEWAKKLVEYEKQNPILQSIEAKFRHNPALLGDDKVYEENNDEKDQLSPAELVALGSVWFLPHDAPRDPSQGRKPIRVELLDLHKALIGGDYLRVHHSPKRFPAINNHDWGSIQNKDEDEEGGTLQLLQNTSLPGVIVSEDPDAGYIVVNKPPGLPVHPTVDNVLENVAGAIGRSLLRKKSSYILLEYEKSKDNLQTIDSNKSTKRSRKKEKIDPLIYVVTPQRLDQNTSGLFVVATKKSFAAYFAKLLRKKTDKELNADTNVGARNSNIQKKYRCLICIITDSKSSDKSSPVSMWDEVDHLKSIAADNTTVRHYLEPSLKAPRTFTKTQDSNSTRSECLMKIRHVGTPFPVIGSTSSNRLCERLWGCKDAKPKKCVAVVEVEVELLTGRTHQIRGQMSTMGFPLCGDLMYGGSLPLSSTQQTSRQGYSDGYRSSDFLSLQCCELTFRDPIQHEKQNKFRLEKSWWSTCLEEYTKSANENVDEATTGALDKSAEIKQLQSMENADSNIDNCDKAINEPLSNIQLCPGKHKYVIIRASKPDQTETEWYVRSSSPAECGGPYHADVAKSLVEKLKKMGYTPVVKGGGRIDFCEKDGHACVYGFSYGFGKGDHQFASLLIEKYSNITALFDDSDLLY